MSLKSNAQKAALSGMLTALAFGLSYLDHLIPLDALFFAPGIKLGLANLVTVFAVHYLGVRPAFAILSARCLLQAFLFGTVSGFLFSITGGMLALLGMAFCFRWYPQNISLLGISMAGAALHNIGQVLCASVYFRSAAVFSYLILLLLLSIPMGCITGGISVFLFQRLDRTVFRNKKV